MAIEDDSLRLDLLQDFGSSATYTDTSAGSSSSITVILTREYVGVDPDATVQVESSEPVAIMRTSDVSDIAQGDTLAIGSDTFTVTSVEPDNEGMTTARLRL